MQYEFVSIGDITTDAFITLKEGTTIQGGALCLSFGEKIEYDSVDVIRAVGNAANAAVSAHRLGLASGLVANIGNDRNGDDCLNALRTEGVDTALLRVHEGKLTNYHYVLRYGAERTILIKHQEYSYALPQFEQPAWLYLTSIGRNSEAFHSEISEYLDANPNIKLAFQPGTFQMEMGKEKMARLYARAELCICNKEEAARILDTVATDSKELLQGMHALGVKQMVITDGPRGAYASDGSLMWTLPMYPDPAPPVDRTGAGDAAASTTAIYLAKGLSLPEALKRGVINSMSVVQHVGAQKGLLSQGQIEDWLKKAPPEFEASTLA